ncbi:MAG: NAD(P)H-dependent glycerol-3-phosphate dehydrogenase [Burkholderiaceae bacterium]|jgi:glycerol-3-phosphate dehydrogenase (NAD(P)+)
MRITVLGAGAWGTALARHASARHPVTLWVRDAAQADAIVARRENTRYLPGVMLDGAISATADLPGAARGADLIVIATSVAGLRPVAQALAGVFADGAAPPVLWLCKGLEAGTLMRPQQVIAQVWPGVACGALSGPSFAQEVAAGLPVALTVASADAAVATAAVEAFHHGAARIYRSVDVVGVEVAGALKNIMAIATGISDGLGLGLNARAALLTRGLAEIGRYGAVFGARPETFMGLAGVGDLVLTCTGDLSRNRRVGLSLARGDTLDTILAALGHVAEGVACCDAVRASARQHRVELPITEAVGEVLFAGRAPRDAVAGLLAREPKAEFVHEPKDD